MDSRAITGVAIALGALTAGVTALSVGPQIITALKAALDLLVKNLVVAATATVVGLAAAIATWVSAAQETGSGNTRTLQNDINELTAAQKTKEMTSRIDEINEKMNELQEEYEKSLAKARESIDSQLGLFNELDGTAKTSINNLIETLKRQVEYMETYAQNIQRAMEMGVDEGLVRKLSDGSEGSA